MLVDVLSVPPVAQSTAALPFGTIAVILVIWSLVTIPLTVFGGNRKVEACSLFPQIKRINFVSKFN